MIFSDARYRLISPISEGGFGSVYLAEQVSLKREVVIKLLKPEAVANDIARERFRREALMISRFSHPNIITYHDSGIDGDGNPFLVMEFLRGETLSSYCRRKFPLPLCEIVRYILEIAGALSYSHKNGIIHRDVKPSNIFIVVPAGEAPFAKLFDFGIAAASKVPREVADSEEFRNLTRTGYIVGTPEYLAPELLHGDDYDGRVDQYALAIVAYEMVSGKRLFAAPNRLEVFMRQTDYSPPPLNSLSIGRRIPERLDAAIAKAMSKDPAERFRSMDEFRDEINMSMRGFDDRSFNTRTSVASVDDDGRTVTSTRVMDGKKWKLPAAVCAGIAALIAGLYYFFDETAVDEHGSGYPVIGSEIPETWSRRPSSVWEPSAMTEDGAEPEGIKFKKRKGRLTVNAIPWGNVYIDGKPAGKTPLMDLEIDAGKRRITVENPALGSESEIVTVKPGEGVNLKFNLMD
ncbi:MAG: serine/threonine protein kinase [Deltaproteobacteria bacterium]|nr:serine/threonine protein kinase [Deltaproteobacteria bacterium]